MILFGLIGAGAVWFSAPLWRKALQDKGGEPKKIVFGVAEHPSGALTLIAFNQGFFAQEGLDLQVNTYASGVLTLKALKRHEVDIVNSADVPVVAEILQGEDLAITAAIGISGNESMIVARKDRGITRPDDLRHKRIGTQNMAAVHFFLYLFLVFNHIPQNDVTLVFYPPEQLPMALARGEIDAFAMREPYIEQAQRLLGEKIIVFEKQALYDRRELVISSKSWVKNHPAEVKKLLQALVRAAAFARAYPKESIAIVASNLKVPPANIAKVWPTMRFDVRLDQSLLVLLEEEARWLIDSGMVSSQSMPNLLDAFMPEPLEQVQKSKARFIH